MDFQDLVPGMSVTISKVKTGAFVLKKSLWEKIRLKFYLLV